MAVEPNLIAVISDAAILAGIIGGSVGLGRKIGWFERKIADMGKILSATCKDVEDLDMQRQMSEKDAARITALYGEKLDNIAAVLAEVKAMLFKHVVNGK